ncbi:MAG: response regulator transcription factor [Bacteriovoracaceae bacterium]|jgi:DNA-binding response OmpR family regulator|nr:response regulator transcription factor [Bacteriovoracaceae bacterium]
MNAALRKRVWVLEDEEDAHLFYEDYLSEKYDLKFFKDFDSFEKALLDNDSPDLALTDLNLGNINFLEEISKVEKVSFPFLVVSSSADRATLKGCFEKGAIDYLVKPFGGEELKVKVEKAFDSLRRDLSNFVKGIDLEDLPDLTMKESKILNLFLASDNFIIDREEVIREIWPKVKVQPKTLDVHLYNLRKKLKRIDLYIVSQGNCKWQLSRTKSS